MIFCTIWVKAVGWGHTVTSKMTFLRGLPCQQRGLGVLHAPTMTAGQECCLGIPWQAASPQAGVQAACSWAFLPVLVGLSELVVVFWCRCFFPSCTQNLWEWSSPLPWIRLWQCLLDFPCVSQGSPADSSTVV